MNPKLDKQYIITEPILSFLEEIQEGLQDLLIEDPPENPEILQRVSRLGGILDTIRFNDFDGDALSAPGEPTSSMDSELQEAYDTIDELNNSTRYNGSWHDETVFQQGFQSGWDDALQELEAHLKQEAKQDETSSSEVPAKDSKKSDSAPSSFATDYKVNPGHQPKVDFQGNPVQNVGGRILSGDGKWEFHDTEEGEWELLNPEESGPSAVDPTKPEA